MCRSMHYESPAYIHRSTQSYIVVCHIAVLGNKRKRKVIGSKAIEIIGIKILYQRCRINGNRRCSLFGIEMERAIAGDIVCFDMAIDNDIAFGIQEKNFIGVRSCKMILDGVGIFEKRSNSTSNAVCTTKSKSTNQKE